MASKKKQQPKKTQPSENKPAGIRMVVDADTICKNGTSGDKGFISRTIKEVTIDPNRLQENLRSFSRSLTTALSDIQAVGNFELDEVSLAVSIDSEGGVNLVGSAKVAIGGEITLKFVRGKKQL